MGSCSSTRTKFAASFAADVDPELAAFMADSQVPWGVDALGGAITEPAWRTKPSWYLVATEDRMIPPTRSASMSQRANATVVEATGSHAIYVSQPEAVAPLDRDRRQGGRLNRADRAPTSNTFPDEVMSRRT